MLYWANLNNYTLWDRGSWKIVGDTCSHLCGIFTTQLCFENNVQIITVWFCGPGRSTRSPLSFKLLTWFRCDTWWRHQMETFSALLALCAGNSPVPHKGQWHGALSFLWSACVLAFHIGIFLSLFTVTACSCRVSVLIFLTQLFHLDARWLKCSNIHNMNAEVCYIDGINGHKCLYKWTNTQYFKLCGLLGLGVCIHVHYLLW